MKNVVGSVYTGEVVQKDSNAYLVDLGIGFDAILTFEETKSDLEVGDFIDVVVTHFVKDDFYVSMNGVLRKRRIEELEELIDTEESITGKVIGYKNNRFLVDLNDNIKGSVYVKNMDLKFIDSGDAYINNEYKFLISGRNTRGFEDFDLDRRTLLLKEREVLKEAFTGKYSVNQEVEGSVKEVNNAGIILDIDGCNCFIPRSEISHKRLANMPEKGIVFKAVITEIQDRNLSLKGSIKQLLEHPFALANDLKVNDIIKGKVARKVDYGIFVELFEGVDGLVHISEVSYEHTKNLDAFEAGQEIEVKVIAIDQDKKKIALSIKRLQPSPFDYLKEKINVGDTMAVQIKRITETGVRVMVMDNYYTTIINEEIHDFSQVKPTLRINDSLEVVVMAIDESSEKVELSNEEFVKKQYEMFDESL